MKFYNTLTKTIEEFRPISEKQVSLYTCGPTVYNFAHIGNLRTYIFEDLLKRALVYNGYQVDHAMNITDVGHLVGDGDEGEDKLEVGAKREGKNPLDIAKFYTEQFLLDIDELNIIRPNKILSATDSIPEQLEIIKLLMQKGFAYVGDKAIYFDTSKLSDYGKLSGQKLSEKQTSREDVVVDPDKKHPADFALWFFLKGRYQNHILQWDSPWGKGFPGWHIECSAISRKLLSQPFDIHCGGVDHIGTHHTNEIAQSEAAFGLPLAKVWMHGEFLQIDAKRMGKSEGNFITLETLKEKGFSPLDYRYFCLTAHYRTQLNFTWESLEAAHKARVRLGMHLLQKVKNENIFCEDYQLKLDQSINADLNIPKALALVWELVDDQNHSWDEKINTIKKFDSVLGLKLFETDNFLAQEIPIAVMHLKDARQQAKDTKNYQLSDEIRKKIEDIGYEVMDTSEGQKIKKKINI